MRLALCVATRTRPDGLARLLEALSTLRQPERLEVEVVVVDNDPGQSARAVVDAARAQLRWPVRYLVEPRPGVSFARNAALDATRGCDLIAFIDDDETPAADWLAELLARHRETGAAAVTGPTEPRFEGKPPAWLIDAFQLCYIRPKPERPLTEVTTGNLLLARAALERHELRFDERLSLVGGEDTLLASELAHAGETIAWAERALVYDHVPASRVRLGWLLRRWYRTGNVEALLAMHARRGLPGRALGLAGGLARLGLGTAALAASLPGLLLGARGHAVRRLYTVARGLGMLASVCGRHHQEYRTIHGT